MSEDSGSRPWRLEVGVRSPLRFEDRAGLLRGGRDGRPRALSWLTGALAEGLLDRRDPQTRAQFGRLGPGALLRRHDLQDGSANGVHGFHVVLWR